MVDAKTETAGKTSEPPKTDAAPTVLAPSEYIQGRYRWVYYLIIAVALAIACYGLVAYRHYQQRVAYDVKIKQTAETKDWVLRKD